MSAPWWTRDIDPRTPKGGAIGIDGQWRRGGEFEPTLVPRPLMPQVDEADYPALFQWAAWQGVAVREETIPAAHLKHHQAVNMRRVRTMPPDLLAKPLLVDRDGYVLDGNHRAAAHLLAGTPAPCCVFDAAFEEAIAVLETFAGTTTGQAL